MWISCGCVWWNDCYGWTRLHIAVDCLLLWLMESHECMWLLFNLFVTGIFHMASSSHLANEFMTDVLFHMQILGVWLIRSRLGCFTGQHLSI